MAWNISGSPVQGHLPVIRSLPNVAASVRAGVSAYSRGHYCNESDAIPFLSVFTLCSHCEEVAEEYLDTFKAFSGSGIAFVSTGEECVIYNTKQQLGTDVHLLCYIAALV